MVKTSFRIVNVYSFVGEGNFNLEIIKIFEMQQNRTMICFWDFSWALFSFLLASNTHFFSNLQD